MLFNYFMQLKGGRQINSKYKAKYIVPILIVALVACIFLLISFFLVPEKSTEAERVLPDVSSAVVADATPIEPISDQPEPVLHVPEGATLVESSVSLEEPFVDATDTSLPEEDDSSVSDNPVNSLVGQREEKLERRTTELSDMKDMLAILEEQNDDPERIELYINLIAKTEKEIIDLQNDIARFGGA